MARISFSSEFLDTQQAIKHDYREAPVSSDFEFSVMSNTSLTLSSAHHADEIFFKGVLLPLKKTTLRDELLVGDDEDLEFGHHALPQLPKMSGRWKERLGLRRPQIFVSDKEDDNIFVPKTSTIKEVCELGKQK